MNRGFLVNPEAERQPGNTGFHGVFTVARPKKNMLGMLTKDAQGSRVHAINCL